MMCARPFQPSLGVPDIIVMRCGSVSQNSTPPLPIHYYLTSKAIDFSRVLRHPSVHSKGHTTCSHAGYPVADGGVHSDREPDCDDVTGADPAHLVPYPLAHPLCKPGVKQMHRTPPIKGKRAGIRPGTQVYLRTLWCDCVQAQ